MNPIKTCKTCDKQKNIGDFGVNKATSDGLMVHCRKCWAAKRWVKNNPGTTLGDYAKYLQDKRKTLDADEMYAKDGLKLCRGCQEGLPPDKFNKNPKNKDGLQHKCRSCESSYHQENRDRILKRQRAYQLSNSERLAEQGRSYYEQNKKSLKKARKVWTADNKDKVAAMAASRRATVLQRTPKWANTKAIEAFYTKAQNLTEETGIEHNVDHVIPLRGELVSGLHVENNLQVIKATENFSKSNKFKPD